MGHRNKLDRANEHFHTLDEEVFAWFSGHPDPLVNVETEGAKHRLIYARDDFPSERFGVLIGDIVQNLRQGLDHLAFELAVFNSPDMTERERESSEFPVFWEEARWPNGKAKKIGCMCECAQAKIERLQPIKAGDPGYKDLPLWQLHELSRIDKHRLLLTLILNTMPGSVATRGSQWQSFEVRNQAPERGAEIAAFSFTSNPEMHVDFNVTFGIAFADGPLEGKMVQLALRELQSKIESDVTAVLEPYLLPHNHIVNALAP